MRVRFPVGAGTGKAFNNLPYSCRCGCKLPPASISRWSHSMKRQCQFAVFCTPVLFGTLAITPAACAEGQTRNYYSAVDEGEWDYTPMRVDQMMGMPFDKTATRYGGTGKHQIGRSDRKAVSRQCTD